MELQQNPKIKSSPQKGEASTKQPDKAQEKKEQDKAAYLGPYWYDGRIVQQIFCTLIPFAFLAAYPLVIISYYTIFHTIMALVFVQITIYKFYINSQQGSLSLEKIDNQLREQFIQKQVVKLHNLKKGFLLVVLIVEALNILSKIIFVIIYYTKDDLDIGPIKNVLLDLEFFFVSDKAKESDVQKSKMILLSFVPNLLLLSVFGLAKKICKYEIEVRIEDFLVPSHQTTQGLLNFLVLVSLVSCQIFNPSIMSFGYLGFFLLSQINSLIVKNPQKSSITNLIIQILIQIFCYVQFILLMFSATNIFYQKEYFNIVFLGFDSIAKFTDDWTKHPFYILSLAILFFFSVIYSQTLNYERQREKSLQIYKQIEKQKKKSRLKRALIKFLTMTKLRDKDPETQSDQIPQSYINKDNIFRGNTINDDDVQIELASYNKIYTEQGIMEDRDKSIEHLNLDTKRFTRNKTNSNEQEMQEFEQLDLDVNDKPQQNKQQSPNNNNNFSQFSKFNKRGSSPFVLGDNKTILDSQQNLNVQDDSEHQDNQNNNYMIINNIRKKQKTHTFTMGQSSGKIENQKRGSLKAFTLVGEQGLQNKIKQQQQQQQQEQEKEKAIETIRQQLFKIENGEDDQDIDRFSFLKKEDKQDELSQEEDLPHIRERSNKILSFQDRFTIFKNKIENYVLELSQKSFIYIKSKFEDSIIPIRFLQCCSILVIMRYPCYYSLGLILWCLLSSIFKFEIKIKFLFIILIPIPCMIVIYSFNLFASIEINRQLYPKHGFVFQKYFWIECIILNTITFFFFTYLLIIRRLKQNLSSFRKSQEEVAQDDQKNDQKVSRNQSEAIGSGNMVQQHHQSVIVYTSNQQDGQQKNDQHMSQSAKIGNNNTPKKKGDDTQANGSNNQALQNRNISKSDPVKDQLHPRFSNHSSIPRFKKDSVNYQEYFENQYQRFSHHSDSQSYQEDPVLTEKGKPQQEQSKPVPLVTIFFAFILKYSQMLALFLLYWIGFYTFNIVHLLLVVFFLIFFQNSMKTINVKNNGKIYEMSFSFKYWYLLLVYLALVIVAKFIYTILEQGMDYLGSEIQKPSYVEDDTSTTIFKFVGISYDYDMPFSLSLSKEDYAGLSIIWIAYMFATLQEDTYRSETYQKYSNKINFLIQELPLVRKYSPNFLSFVNKLTILVKNMLFWLSFFAITTCLILQDFSFINSVLLLNSFCLIFYYIFKYKDPQLFNYEKYYKVWYIFNQVIIGYILLCYILQFTALKFVHDNIIDQNTEAYKIFNNNRDIYGFYSELSGSESLRYKFFPIIFVLYFAIYVQNYLKMISNAVKNHNEELLREKAVSNNSAGSGGSKKNQKQIKDPLSVMLNPDMQITIDIINKNYQKMRKEENRQIYNNYVLFDLYSEVANGIDSILKVMSFIMIDLQNFMVFIFAMVFRLSLSMLIFIVIYLKFYYSYHHKLENFLERNYMKKSIHYFFKAYQKFFSFPQKNLGWKIKEEALPVAEDQIKNRDFSRRNGVVSAKYLNQLVEKKLIEEQEQDRQKKLQEEQEKKQKEIELTQQQQQNNTPADPLSQAKRKRLSKRNILEVGIEDKINQFVKIQGKLKIDEQLTIWGYSFWFSFFCISVTYGAQFLATDMAQSNIDNSILTEIQWFLFIFGTSCTTLSLSNIFRNIYFYIIMFWMNITIFVLIRMKVQHDASVQQQQAQQYKEMEQNKLIEEKENIQNPAINSNAQKVFKLSSDTIPGNAILRASKSPIGSMYPRKDSLDSLSQFNRLTYLHLNAVNQGNGTEQNNELNEQRIEFEQKRVKRVQESENDVEIHFDDEGGLLPQKIKWCRLIQKHFKEPNDNSDEEEEEEDEEFFAKNEENDIESEVHIQNIYQKYKNDQFDAIQEKNYADQNNINTSSNDFEGIVEDEGGINLVTDKLGENSKFKTKMMTVLNDQFEIKKNPSMGKSKKGEYTISQEQFNLEIEKKRKIQEKIKEKQRQEEEMKQRQILRNDCDFIYNNYLRIQYFYEMKACYVAEKCKSSLLLALYPFYSVILMHVSEQKHDIFSYIYLFVAFFGNSIKGINRNTIFLVLLQYILLLLNINEVTSPLKIDTHLLEFRKMSLIQRYISDDEILQYLAFSSINTSSSTTVSFILNAMVFFIIGFYFSCYKYIIRSIAVNINIVKNRIKNIYENNLFPQQIAPISQSTLSTAQDDQNNNVSFQYSAPELNLEKKQTQKFEKSQISYHSNPNLSTYSLEMADRYEQGNDEMHEQEEEVINTAPPIWINYQNWRSSTFFRVNLMYEMSISFGYIISAVLIMVISCQYLDIFNFIILVYNMIIFFITEFIVPFPQMLNQKKKIINLLKVLQFYLYGVFALYSTMQIPYVKNNISSAGSFISIQLTELIIIDKIYIMFCVVCTQQLLQSSDFKTITYSVSQSYILNANLSHKAVSMHQNDVIISELLSNEKERRSLREVVQRVTQTLKNWHKAQQYLSSSNANVQFGDKNQSLSIVVNNNNSQSFRSTPRIPTNPHLKSNQQIGLSNFAHQTSIIQNNDSSEESYALHGENANNLVMNKQKSLQLKKKGSKSMGSPLQTQALTQPQLNLRKSHKYSYDSSGGNESPPEKQSKFGKAIKGNQKIVLEQVQNAKQNEEDIKQNTNQIVATKQSSHIELLLDYEKKEEVEDLDYSSDDLISNTDEQQNKDFNVIVRSENPKFIQGQFSTNLNNSMNEMTQSKNDQMNKSTYKKMKIKQVSSIDHLEQTLQFDQNSPLKKSMNASKIEFASDQVLRPKKKEKTKVNFQSNTSKNVNKRKSFKEEKEEKANRYHNIENIQATKKYVKDTDSSDTDYDEDDDLHSSDEIDEENNDLMEQIKQEFEKNKKKQEQQKEALQKGGKQQKRETSHKILIKLCKAIESQINPFLFMDSIQMTDYILENNCQIFSKIYVKVEDLLLNNYTSIMEYSHLLSIVYYCLYQTIQEIGIEFAFNNLYAIIQRATECDITSRMIYDQLIETSSLYPTIPYYYHLRKEQEKNIEDKRILQREQRNNLNHICLYHSQLPFYVYNVKSTNSLPFYLHTKIGLISRIMKSLFKMALSNWHFICFLFYLTYYFSNSGVMSMPFPCLVFLNFLIEKRFVSLRIWMISFAYVSILLFFKFIIQINGIEMDPELQKTFFNDNLNFSYEGYLIFLIFVAQIISKYIGLDKEDLYNSENVHQSYVRKCVNDLEFRQDFIDCQQESQNAKQQKQIEIPSPKINKQGTIKQISRLHSRKVSNNFDNIHRVETSDIRFDSQDELNHNDNNERGQNLIVFGKQARGKSDEVDENLVTQFPNNTNDNEQLLVKTLKKQSSYTNRNSSIPKNSWKQHDQQFLEDYSMGGVTGTNRHQEQSLMLQQSNIQQEPMGQSLHVQRYNQLSAVEQERSISMHEQMLKDLRKKPTLLVNQSFKKENFFKRIFNTYNKRSGRDFYPWIALVQVIILLFIFIFYTRIDANNTQGINEQLKYNQFSGEMVICLFIQVAFMVIERYLALRRVSEQTEKQKAKKKKKKSSKSSSSSDESDDSANSQDNFLQNSLTQSDGEDSLIMKLTGYPSFHQNQDQNEDNERNRRISSNSQRISSNSRLVKRAATFKKDVQNIQNLRSSTKISQEYENYRNYQEMQSLILNQEEEDEADQNNKNQRADKPIPQNKADINESQPTQKVSEQQQTANVELNKKEENVSATQPNARKRSFAPTTPNNRQSKKSVLEINEDEIIKIRQQRKLSLALRDEVLFANLEKEQINANLEHYKQYGNMNNKKDIKAYNSSSDDESLLSNSSAFSKSNLPNLNDQPSKENENENDKNNQQQKDQVEVDIENQIPESKTKSKNKKEQALTYPNDKEIKGQGDTQATQQFTKGHNNSDSLDIFSQKMYNNARNSFEDNSPKSNNSKEDKKNKKEPQPDPFVLTTELLKYIQMIIFIILFSWFVFFYIPKSFKKNTIDDQAIVVTYKTNGYLTAFVFIVCIYMLLSTLQLRYGYKKLKLRNTILQSKNNIAGFCAIIVRAIPFLQELKVMLDWTVTKTSLTLFQWFLLEDIHYSLYVAKLDSKDARSTKVDAPQSKVIKIFLGLLSVLGILLLIFGPMLLFSTLNPIADYNGITGGQIELGLEFFQNSQVNYYPLFQNTHINNLQTVTRDCTYSKDQTQKPAEEKQTEICYWDKYKFKNVNLIFTSDQQQFQKFDLYSYSEKQWDISQPSRKDIKKKFNEIINDSSSQMKARFVIKLLLNREVSQYNSVPYISYYPNTSLVSDSNSYLNKSIIEALLNTMEDCNMPAVRLPNFYIQVFSSTTDKQSYISEPIIYKDKNEQTQFVQDAYVNLECFTDTDPNNPNIVRKETYWKLSIDSNQSSGLTFFTLSDKYSNAAFGFSIITLYTSVILVIGKFIRDAFSGELEKIIIKCMPNPDELLRLCEAISNARNEKDLLRERILYFELMDLIRSPEILKKLTGSYSFVLNQKHKLELEQEKNEEELKKEKKLEKKRAKKKLKQKEKQEMENLKWKQNDSQIAQGLMAQQQQPNNMLANHNFQIEEQIEEEDQEEKTQFQKKKTVI